ncbi:MAG: TOBE domain-containing protein [Terriglobales bacterium]
MKYLTARVAAQRLGVSYPTLKQWIYRKAIQAMRTPGGHYRVPESEIERLRAQPSVAGPVRISGRNQLHGQVRAIRRDGLLAAVILQIGDQQIQAVITSEAVDDLGLEVGAPATALIKATEVMLMK